MGEHEVELGGKARTLKYRTKYLRQVERTQGRTLALILMNMSLDDLAQLLWAGLVVDDKRLTIDQVSDLIDQHYKEHPGDTQGLTDMVVDGLIAAGFFTRREDEDKKEGGDPNAQASQS